MIMLCPNASFPSIPSHIPFPSVLISIHLPSHIASSVTYGRTLSTRTELRTINPLDGRIHTNSASPYHLLLSVSCHIFRPTHHDVCLRSSLYPFFLIAINKNEVQIQKKNYSTWYSRMISHCSTNQAVLWIAAEIGRDLALS